MSNTPNIIVAGSGTGVGKTVVSAILTTLLKGEYWKPIECGTEESDTATMKQWIDHSKLTIHPPTYSLMAPVSPHHAARLENRTICSDSIQLPQTENLLIIESVGGILVPLTLTQLSIDLFKTWNCRWIVISKHYLGSINHTLLTLEALKQRKISVIGLIFNGEPNPDSEEAIFQISQLPLLGRLLPEPFINPQTIQRYAKQWQPLINKYLP